LRAISRNWCLSQSISMSDLTYWKVSKDSLIVTGYVLSTTTVIPTSEVGLIVAGSR